MNIGLLRPGGRVGPKRTKKEVIPLSVNRLPIFKEDGHIRNTYCYILICRDGGGPHYLKFGHTIIPGTRIHQLMTGCPIPGVEYRFMLVDSDPKAYKLERALHEAFRARRTRGEWFKFNLDSEADRQELELKTAFCIRELEVHYPVWTRIDLPAWAAQNKIRCAIWRKKFAANRLKMGRRARLMAEENRARRAARTIKFMGEPSDKPKAA